MIPKTPLGKWSVGLLLAFLILLISGLLLIASGQRGGDTFFSNLLLAIPMLSAALAGVGAFFTGVISLFKRERSVMVFIAILVGAFVVLFVSGEIFSPH